MQLGRRSSSESPPGNLATGLDPGRDTPARWKKCLRFRQQGPREAILGHLDGLLMLLKASRNWRLYLEGSVRASVAHRGECAPAMARTCVVLVRAQRLPGMKRQIRQPHFRLYKQGLYASDISTRQKTRFGGGGSCRTSSCLQLWGAATCTWRRLLGKSTGCLRAWMI